MAGPLVGSRMTAGAFTRRGMPIALAWLVLAGACRGTVTPAAVPSPSGPTAPPPPAVAAVRRTALPANIPGASWIVTSAARLRVNGVADEQRVESQARVSWTFDRHPSGSARATGQVDAFSVRSSLDSGRTGAAPPAARLLLDGLLDSAVVRVVTRPPQANECDRYESSAAALARELLVRVPDGFQVGDRWRDSTVSLVCRSGVPITVYTTIISRVERLTDEVLVVRREIQSTLDGRGGSAFRSLELVGTGSGEQRVEINAQTGILERLVGTSTLTLKVTEHTPSLPPRTQDVVQRVELKAERVTR